MAAVGRPRAADADETVQLDRGRGPIELELRRVHLVRVQGFARLWLGFAETVRDRIEYEPRANGHEFDSELVRGRVLTDRHFLTAVHRARVEPFLDVHHAHTRHFVTG